MDRLSGLRIFCVYACCRCLFLTPHIIKIIRTASTKRKNDTPEDRAVRFRRSLYIGLCINFIYAATNLAVSIMHSSIWMASNGLYYLVNTVIHFILLCFERKRVRMKDGKQKELFGWTCFCVCGWLLFVLHLTMTGIIFQMIWRNHGDNYPGIMIFAVAAFTFYKLIIAIIRVIRHKENLSPILGAARNIDLSEALMSLFALQTGLLTAFGKDFTHQHLMNTLTGGAVCMLAMLGAIGMILHGTKKKNQIGER